MLTVSETVDSCDSRCTCHLHLLLQFPTAVRFQLLLRRCGVFALTLGAVVEIKLLALVYFDLDSGWWRYVGMSDLRDITKASLLSSAVIWLFVTCLIRRKVFRNRYM